MKRFLSTVSVIALIGSYFVATSTAASAAPVGFVEEVVKTNLHAPVGMTFLTDKTMLYWEKAGKLFFLPGPNAESTQLLDLSQEVKDYWDHGMLGVAVRDPYEATYKDRDKPKPPHGSHRSTFVYLFYTVDRAYLYAHENQNGQTYTMGVVDQPGDTILRLTRYELRDPYSDHPTILPNSRTVLLGFWMTRRDAQGNLTPPHIVDAPASTSASHGADTLAFGADGSLLVSVGDGAIWGGIDTGGDRLACGYCGSDGAAEELGILPLKAQIGAFRAQLKDSYNGKILRINPDTGAGYKSNPFYDAARPRSAQSLVYALGFRNPFRFSVQPLTGDKHDNRGEPGTLLVGEVGWNTWEEVDVVTDGGQNFGWPVYEGMKKTPGYSVQQVANLDAPNNEVECELDNYLFINLIAQETLNPLSFPHPCDAGVQIPMAYTFEHSRPALDWNHSHDPITAEVPRFDGGGLATLCNLGEGDCSTQGESFPGRSSLGGVYYAGRKFPAAYRNRYYFGDTAGAGTAYNPDGWIKMATFNGQYQVLAVDDFLPSGSGKEPVDMKIDPGQYAIYWVHYGQLNVGEIRRIVVDCNANGIGDDIDVASGTSRDRDRNGMPDECD